MAKGKVKAMHIKSMAGGHTLRVEREPDGDEGNTMMGGEESMHPDGSPGADHIAGLMTAHNAIKGKAPKKSGASMPPEAMSKAFGR